MNANKEEELFIKRIKELAQQAYNKGICTYTDFLNLNELNLFYTIEQSLATVSHMLWGGHEHAERKMIAFFGDGNPYADMPEAVYATFPIMCVQIKPLNAKYSDAFTHRDYLGAILNLGIDRGKTGDILSKDNIGYAFCNPAIATFLVDNLIRIKHTSVECQVVEMTEFNMQPDLQTINGTVSSIRLDSILSLAFRSSRSSLTGLIAGGKVFVNGKLTQSNSYQLKEGDVVSVRGLGKFIYSETSHQTKKGRYSVTVYKY